MPRLARTCGRQANAAPAAVNSDLPTQRTGRSICQHPTMRADRRQLWLTDPHGGRPGKCWRPYGSQTDNARCALFVTQLVAQVARRRLILVLLPEGAQRREEGGDVFFVRPDLDDRILRRIAQLDDAADRFLVL